MFAGREPGGIQGSELSQWNLYGTHLQLQENGCVHSSVAQLDVHWCGTLGLFENPHNMCHCNSC